jgi:hypothetical protein
MADPFIPDVSKRPSGDDEVIRSARAALVAVAVLAPAACGSGSDTGPTPSAGRISTTGRLEILEPQPGMTVQGDSVTVRVRVSGARVIPQATTKLAPDEGHIHLTLDGRLVNLLGGLEERLTGLAPGQHVLQAEFVAGDHGPFSPRVIQVVTFTVA